MTDIIIDYKKEIYPIITKILVSYKKEMNNYLDNNKDRLDIEDFLLLLLETIPFICMNIMKLIKDLYGDTLKYESIINDLLKFIKEDFEYALKTKEKVLINAINMH